MEKSPKIAEGFEGKNGILSEVYLMLEVNQGRTGKGQTRSHQPHQPFELGFVIGEPSRGPGEEKGQENPLTNLFAKGQRNYEKGGIQKKKLFTAGGAKKKRNGVCGRPPGFKGRVQGGLEQGAPLEAKKKTANVVG